MMKKVILVLSAIFVFCSLVVAGEKGIVAKVNGKPIYKKDLDRVFNEILIKNRISPDSVDVNNPQFSKIKRELLEQMANRELLAQHAEKEMSYKGLNEDVENDFKRLELKFKNEKEFLDALSRNSITKDELKEKIRKNILIRRYINKIKSGIKVTEKEIKDFYDANKRKFVEPEAVKVRHIIITTKNRTEKEAKDLIYKIFDKLKKGESFEKLAREYSEDGSAKNGGMLGFIKKGDTVKNFEKVIFGLKPNEMSKPFKTKFGYHIAKVEEKRDKKFYTLRDKKVVDFIKKTIEDKKLDDILSKKFEEWRKKEKVEILL